MVKRSRAIKSEEEEEAEAAAEQAEDDPAVLMPPPPPPPVTRKRKAVAGPSAPNTYEVPVDLRVVRQPEEEVLMTIVNVGSDSTESVVVERIVKKRVDVE